MTNLDSNIIEMRKSLYKKNRKALSMSMVELDRFLHLGLQVDARRGFSSRREKPVDSPSSRVPTYSDLLAQELLKLLQREGYALNTIGFEAGIKINSDPVKTYSVEREAKEILSLASRTAKSVIKNAEYQADAIDVSPKNIRRIMNIKLKKDIIKSAHEEAANIMKEAKIRAGLL